MRNNRLARQAGQVATSFAAIAAFAAIIAAIGGWSQQVHADAPDTPAEASAVAVQTVRVQRAEIAQTVRAYGVVGASASNLTTVNLPYGARLVQVLVQPGQRVARGAPLAVVQADSTTILAADQARSAATLAQGELARTQKLYEQRLATQGQLAAAQKAAEDARQTLVAQHQMGIATAPKTVVAPFDGVVLQIPAGQGELLPAGTPILQLAGAHGGRGASANVLLGVDPASAIAIRSGDAVMLHGLSSTLANAAVPGRVVLVGSSINAQSQLVDIGANVPLGQTAFIPGMHVSADIVTAAGTHWVVPRSAVLKDDKGAYVFQTTPQHKARRVAVSIKVENGSQYGVDGKLDGAQPLVVTGNYELQDGMAVQTNSGKAP